MEIQGKSSPKVVFNLILLVLDFFFTFLAILAPLMFLVGVIAGLDRWGAHNRFLRNLETRGKTTKATVTYVNKHDYAGLRFNDANGRERFGRLDFHYYPAQIVEAIQPGDTLDVVYIDALISESEKIVLAGYYDMVKTAPPVTSDVWWLLGISWLVVALRPQFVFFGMLDLTRMFIPHSQE